LSSSPSSSEDRTEPDDEEEYSDTTVDMDREVDDDDDDDDDDEDDKDEDSSSPLSGALKLDPRAAAAAAPPPPPADKVCTVWRALLLVVPATGEEVPVSALLLFLDPSAKCSPPAQVRNGVKQPLLLPTQTALERSPSFPPLFSLLPAAAAAAATGMTVTSLHLSFCCDRLGLDIREMMSCATN